ncbi:Trimethylguanosine synthase [Senna tora]|uniref:Trimethylguanosine synthase n=1 Tax=Senna tora TaxID=362788 RepID=A0A834TYZ6_9FABA|nr:Trimethylguanosine synthase [Senna tora]
MVMASISKSPPRVHPPRTNPISFHLSPVILSLRFFRNASLLHPRLFALKTGADDDKLLKKPAISSAQDVSGISDEDKDNDGNGDYEVDSEEERWVDWEDQILEDTVPLVALVRMILHSGKYESGDRLSPELEKTILEKLLPFHPNYEKKIGCGVDYITTVSFLDISDGAGVNIEVIIVFCLLSPFISEPFSFFLAAYHFSYCWIVCLTHLENRQSLSPYFARTDKKSINSISHSLDIFLSCSGLTINNYKSGIWFSPNTTDAAINEALTKLQFPRTQNLGSYLGIPLGMKGRICDFKPILEKIKGRLDSWNTRFLSPAGKITLLNSVISPMAGFYMQCVPFPFRVCNQLDKLQRDFFWTTTAGKSKIHTVCWENICKPKPLGGLGIFKSRERNLTFLAKLSWQVTQALNLPWAKLLHHYLQDSSRSRSLLGKGLIRSHKLLSEGLIHIVYSGEDTKFWTDNWTSLGPLRNLIQGPLNIYDINLSVKDLSIDLGKWHWDRIPFVLPQLIIDRINATPILKNSTSKDIKAWRFNPSGQFDLKLAYIYALNLMPQYGVSPTHSPIKWVWRTSCHSRLKFFLWSCVSNALPCRSILNRRGINVPPHCPTCGHHEETISHIFMECPNSKLIWQHLNTTPTTTDFLPWLKQNALCDSSSSLNTPLGTNFIYCLWHIWLSRNQLIFKNQNWPPNMILRKGLAAAAEFFHLNPQHSSLLNSNNIQIKWHPPIANWWKLNTDGACSGNPGPFAIGGIIRDHNGSFISGYSSYIGFGTALKAELWAISVGLRIALSLNCNFIHVESDSLLAVKFLKDNNIPDTHHLHNLLLSCRSSLQEFTEFSISHVYREGNQCADSLAKQALLNKTLMTTFDNTPVHIRLPFLADLHGVHFIKSVSSSIFLHQIGSKMNFGNDPGGDNIGGGRPPGNFSLARQPSVYSLTFDEFVNTMGSSGKDFGSMNMDELLKNIWSAEEVQTMASVSGNQQGGSATGGHLQKQGSLTLPRTLSQKTVDEVWKDISKDNSAGKDAPNIPQRQQTLGEMTLEEFLVRAGVVREDAQAQAQLMGKPNGRVFTDFSRTGNNSGLGMGFQQMNKAAGLMGNRIPGNNEQISLQTRTNLPLNVNGVRSNQQVQQLPNSQSPQQQIFPKHPAMPYATQIPLTSNSHAQLGNQGIRGGIVGLGDQGLNGNLVHSSALQGGGMGMVGLGPGAVHVATGSPANQMSSDEIGKHNGDNSSVSPVPYVFNGSLRGRKSGGAVEKVIERRQRRMIKNRESAARSRARKQAYTMELEAEVAKLKEENEELRRKQEEIKEMQKNQVMEMMNLQQGVKKRCLRRTQTGPCGSAVQDREKMPVATLKLTSTPKLNYSGLLGVKSMFFQEIIFLRSLPLKDLVRNLPLTDAISSGSGSICAGSSRSLSASSKKLDPFEEGLTSPTTDMLGSNDGSSPSSLIPSSSSFAIPDFSTTSTSVAPRFAEATRPVSSRGDTSGRKSMPASVLMSLMTGKSLSIFQTSYDLQINGFSKCLFLSQQLRGDLRGISSYLRLSPKDSSFVVPVSREVCKALCADTKSQFNVRIFCFEVFASLYRFKIVTFLIHKVVKLQVFRTVIPPTCVAPRTARIAHLLLPPELAPPLSHRLPFFSAPAMDNHNPTLSSLFSLTRYASPDQRCRIVSHSTTVAATSCLVLATKSSLMSAVTLASIEPPWSPTGGAARIGGGRIQANIGECVCEGGCTCCVTVEVVVVVGAIAGDRVVVGFAFILDCFSASTRLSATRRLVVVGPGILGLVLEELVWSPDDMASAGRDDGVQVSSSAERSIPAEADDDNVLHLVPTAEGKQMSALGLPLSFHTNKERNGLSKGKKKGTRSMLLQNYHNSIDKTLSRVSEDEVLSPANFPDNTSNILSSISMLGESESCHCDVAAGLNISQCASGEDDNSEICTEVAYGVTREQNYNKNEDVTDGAENGELLTSTIFLSDDLKIASSSPTRASTGGGSNLTGAGVNHYGIEKGEQLVDNECLEVSSIVSKVTEHETICNSDGAATWQPRTHESDSFPMSSEGIGYEKTTEPNDCAELGEWMAYWDTFYMRNYFYNIRTHVSTWNPPPGMEHLAIGGCTEMDDGVAVTATEEHGSQNKTNPLEETSIKEKLAGQPHDECAAEIEFTADNVVSDISVQSEGRSLDHSYEFIERSSCNDGVSFCSISDNKEHNIGSQERCIKETSEGNDVYLDVTVAVANGSHTKPDPSLKIQEMKVKRNRRQRRLYNETKGLQFQEMNEECSATIGKYWCQRYSLFSRFDHGIKMDEEGWFSVTPEAIARHHALQCASGIIVDCFTGVGGNAIQFAQWCRHVIAIDIDPRKIDYARHNAAIYGVDDQIDFIVGDFFHLAPNLKADTVFLSPPWGGPDYAKVVTYDMKTMLKPQDGYFLFNVAKEIASRVVMFLPRNTNLNQLAELSLSACPPWSLEVEKVFLNGKLKAITAYFSDTAVGF